MKERDIVDFEKMEKNEYGYYIDENGKEVGCEHCYVHEKAFEKLNQIQGNADLIRYPREIVPLCPECGKPLSPYTSYGYENATVSEVNYSNPTGEIGLYEMWHCEDCDQDYAMMPIPVVWNANHDTHYTGGRDYAEDEDIEKLVKDVFEKIEPSIEQYIRRKLNPEDGMDRILNIRNVNTWCSHDVEHAICNWLYEKGYKK